MSGQLSFLAPAEPTRPPRPCGNADCAISTGEHDGLTFGRGDLDKHGYWEIPCGLCARAYERDHPGFAAWPFAVKEADRITPNRSDVVRSIEHKVGPFRELKDGQVTREYRILDLVDGTFIAEFTDSAERQPLPASLSRVFIDDAIRFGMYVEVSA